MTIYIPGKLILNNGLRPQAIAGVAPTLDYRFARDKRETEAVSLTDKLTFTGGNQGTFVGSDGYIQRATTNVPRFDHDPVSLVSEGLLVEGSRQNLLLRSEEFENAQWVKVRCSITANATTAPDSTATADKFVEDTSTNTHIFQLQGLIGVTAGTTYTYSWFFKAAERADFRVAFGLDSGVFAGETLDLNLTTGALTNVSGFSSTPLVTSFPDGWWRLQATVTAAASASPVIRGTPLVGGNSSYTGDGTSGLYLWGAQLEAGSTPSTYIPTTTTAVTRTADSAVIDGTGVLTGTYTMVAKPEGSAQVSGSTIVLQEGYTTERVMVFPATLTAQQITDIREAM
jgi:hypothetical protein